MKINILMWHITIERRKKTLRHLTVAEVEKFAKAKPGRADDIGTKISRIRAVRELAPSTNLKDAKEWVEENFR